LQGLSGAQGGAAPPLVVNIQYIKDLSFEVPGAPAIFTTLRAAPRVDINLDVQANLLRILQEKEFDRVGGQRTI
jgi:preprotein translocase subunit SecB